MADEVQITSTPHTSTDRLVKALTDAGYTVLAEKAKQGVYDDYRSPLAAPKTQLVSDLLTLKDKAFAARVKSGEFDSTKEEADAWLASQEGLEQMKEMVG